MDDRRFDSLVKSLANGASRRSVLKGILGLSGAAIAGGTLLESETDAARRPTPTPTPVKCPGKQTPVNGVCTCPGTAPNKCGPDCCTGKPGDPPSPSHSECCDNACCFGTCYGEELCCPTNPGAGESPPTHRLCDGPSGPVCVQGTCCDDSDCGDPCQVCSPRTHTCEARCDSQTQVCCTEQAGPGVCVTGECCPGTPCGEGLTCCQGPASTICCPSGNTCQTGECTPPCQGELCNGGVCCTGGFCDRNGDCCASPNVGCNGGTCCDGSCDGTGECCPASHFNCNGGKCCSVDCDRQGNCPCSEADPCGDGETCCDGTCIDATDNCGPTCDEQCLYRCGALDTGCECGICPRGQFCIDSTGWCCGGTGLGTDENCAYCYDACGEGTTCQPDGNGSYACVAASCAPNCDCTIEANDGLDCNGGIAGGGGVCAYACGGYCIVPLDGCPCGCEGDTECIHCLGGQCVTYNESGSCNDGAGTCSGGYCV